MAHSTPTPKPVKPRPDFPLFPHATGRWAKKVRGKLVYFGKVADDQKGKAALLVWLDQKDDLLAGRTPRTAGDALTVADLVNQFLTSKEQLVATGEIQQRTWHDYYLVCERIVRVFGRNRLVSDLAVDDFAKLRADSSKTRGPVALSNDIARARVLFKWGFDSGLIDTPMRFGPGFKRPTRKTLRMARADNGPRMFERGEVLAMLDAATQPLRTMILLGLNCGLGNSDVAKLPLAAIDLDAGWLDFPRPKTGIGRRIPLWPESIESLRDWIAKCPKGKGATTDGLVFVTRAGGTWSKSVADNPVCKETAKLLKRIGLHRPGRNFYSLRRTFRTVASECRDEAAADHIMGHAPRSDDMAAVYTQRIGDDRLRAVTNYVRGWLFDTEETK